MREEKELARTRVGTRQVQGPKWARARSLGRLAGMLQAQAKRMPKDKILKKNRVGSLVAAHQAANPAAEAEATTEAGTPSRVSGSKAGEGPAGLRL